MKPDIRVGVCTNRSPTAVAEALEALHTQVPGGRLALVTSGLDRAAVAAHRGAFAGTVLEEPRPGLSRARNRALAWAAAERAGVLAFVDDDAVADPGWWEALGRRWDEAPAEVACIGGPIRPRYDAQPPPWFSDGIAHVLTLLDRGPDVRDLDAAYGANISFRVGPLVQVGGFDPALGHAGGRIFFAEEVAAQRALQRLGFHTRYVPDASVLHVIPPERLTRASFLRRRFAYGQTVGMERARTRSLAARQAISSLVGALATRDGKLAMERATRAAENLGALYGSTRPRLIA
jgi:GT2 family glycosyltransferase